MEMRTPPRRDESHEINLASDGASAAAEFGIAHGGEFGAPWVPVPSDAFVGDRKDSMQSSRLKPLPQEDAKTRGSRLTAASFSPPLLELSL